MILEKVRSIDINSDIEGVQGGISADSLPFMFRILSKSYYSRKIDSIVRELVSNCFDSHTEAGVKEPVIVERRYDIENDTYNIIFKDVGVGMNPERMYKIFNQWFTSTKRESNDYIGSFGLGSKSPFSYTDVFNIITVHDGIKYDYDYVLGDSLPELISNYGYDENQIPKGQPTTDRNGTEIIIQLLNKNDFKSFEESIKKELCYFDDVYTVGFPNCYNDYSIYRKDSFLFRPHGSYSDELHIVLGKCCYPIDWKAINRERVNLPFGIRFEIGELQVTPNRESLVYDASDDDTIANKIKAKIDLVLQEVNDLISKGGESRETSDLKFYLVNRNRKPAIWFGNYRLDIPVEYITDRDIALQFSPLKHLPIVIPTNPFFYYNVVGHIAGEVYSKYDTHNFTEPRLFYNDYIKLDTETNQFTNAFIDNAFIIRRDRIKKNYHNIAKTLGFYTYQKGYRNQYSLGTSADPHYDYINRKPTEDEKWILNRNKERWVRRQVVLGKAKAIYEYLKYIDSLAETKITTYSSHAPTDEWVAEYKRQKRESSLAYQKKLNGEVTIINDFGSREVIKLSSLSHYTNVVYYVTEGRKVEVNKDVEYYKDKLSNIKSIANPKKRPIRKDKVVKGRRLLKGEAFYRAIYWKKHYKFIGISKSNLGMLNVLDNIVPLETMEKFPLFKKYDVIKANIKKLKEIDSLLWQYSSYIRYDIRNYIGKQITYLESKFINIDKYSIREEIPDKDIVDLHSKYIKEIKKLDVLGYINSNMPKKYLVPITSKLKCLYLRTNLLGMNPVEVKPERVINQTAII